MSGDGTELARATAALGRLTDARPAADVEVSVDRHRVGLTRFANSVIHQNVADDITKVSVRIHEAGRTASAAATVVGDGDLDALVARVLAAADVAPLDPGWPGVAPSVDLPSVDPADAATASASPAARAQVVRDFVDGADGLETAGYVRTSHWVGAFANSAGHTAIVDAGECALSGIARRDGADGVARHAPRRLDQLDGHALGARAAAKAAAWRDPVELAPDRYEVVLEPTAVADVLEALAGVGFNGKFVTEGRSFARVGEAQFDPAITLVDDPLAAGQRYDADGTPRQTLTLVEDGTTVAVTYDRRAAAEAGTTSTGHANVGRFAWGPAARHLGLRPSAGGGAGSTNDGSGPGEVDGPVADAAVAALVGEVERGILVSDLWYTRLLDPRTLVLTGLTRNGVWLIEHGEVTTPLRNFRFTQSYAQALMPGNVLGVGTAAWPVPGDTYGETMPHWGCAALRLASWNFTGGASG